ncbi:MAG TPA: hypothetical protein PK156_27635 [Polyangium sp.]|nr:hypothetical protein [Polyangium sp.]
MIANEDRQRLLESRHDIAAAEPTSMTSNAAYQAAAAQSRDHLAAKRADLHQVAQTHSREKSETDAGRATLAAAVSNALRWYEFVRDRAESRLLKPAPNVHVDVHEMERRQKLFARVFGIAPSSFSAQSTQAVIETFGMVAEALTKEPDLVPLKLDDDMRNAHQAAEAAAVSLNREIDEDSAAQKALRQAREAFDRAARTHARIVEGILVHENKEDDLGQYVLSRDPAYAARRKANAPLSEEPGAETIEQPTGG